MGVSTRQFWLLMDARLGMDYKANPAEMADSDWLPRLDTHLMSATIRSQNAEVHLELARNGSISLVLALKNT